MTLDKLSELGRPRVNAPLDDGFRPASLVNRAFRGSVSASGGQVPLSISIERGGGQVSALGTSCFDESHPMAPLNLPYAERLVKFLLWQWGGWRIVVAGPRSVGAHIKNAYTSGGARAFDAEFMGGVYEKPFTVEVTDNTGAAEVSEQTQSLGRYLDGCRIGFDLGASDRKVAAVIDGEAVFTEEVVWDPRNATDPGYHYNELMAALKSAAAHMPRVDAIGGSSAGVYINNRPRVASLFRGIPRDLFESKIANLFRDLQKAWGGVPFEVINDGEVTALAGSMSLEDNAVLGIAMGSSEAGGYVTPNGDITTWLNEVAFCPVDYNPQAAVDEWSGDAGCGVQYFSQQAVFRLAPKAGILLDDNLTPADKLKSVQELLQKGDKRALEIWQTIGVYMGYGLAHYADLYDLKHVLILGRVTSGDGGGIILEKAREVLAAEFPEILEQISLHLPDESTRRVGQAVAASSLPMIDK